MSNEQGNVAFGAVAIGRNEGERLRRCLESLSGAASVVYVNSGSTDGSVDWARQHGVDVVELDLSRPFTAARARNAGFRRLRKIAPELLYVQFVDGDCELNRDWPDRAMSYLHSNANVAAVCGRRRERFPKKSVYNWLCDLEWDRPPGETRACGGDVMLRAVALEAVGGYSDELIAGEEPELCVRLRAAGWRVWRLDVEMTLHDAAMTQFGQWWRRAVRAGYAFGQGSYLHGGPPERHYVWEVSPRMAVGCVAAVDLLDGWSDTWTVGLDRVVDIPIAGARQTLRNSGPLRARATLAFFQVLARFPEAWGEIMFLRDRIVSPPDAAHRV